MDKGTTALKELLLIDNIGDGASHEHGDILIQLLQNLGDDLYSNVLSTVPTNPKNNLYNHFYCIFAAPNYSVLDNHFKNKK